MTSTATATPRIQNLIGRVRKNKRATRAPHMYTLNKQQREITTFAVMMTSWARSIQPKFPEISVQNSMDRFGPTGKVSKKRVHLLRWSSFPGRIGWNFG